MNPVMYIFVNRGLEMTPGKIAAQAAHAAVEAFRISDQKMIDRWYRGGHHTKIVLAADDEAQMANIAHYLSERGFKSKQIIDEGRTEIKAFSRTALGVEIVNKDDPHTASTFESFKTYKPLKESKESKPKVSWWKRPFGALLVIFLLYASLGYIPGL
jgi:peptidyl-tRNA hydrolase, PTH2 family